MSQWFRMYNEVLDDPKVQRLPAEAFKAWVNLLCLAARHEGSIPSLADIAFALRVPETKAETLVETLLDAGLIDATETGYAAHNWNGRQFKSDVSNERVKRHRQRQRNGERNVTATPPETPPDTDTESDTESPLNPPKGKSRKRAAKQTPEPDGFSELWALWPRKEGKQEAVAALRKAVMRATIEEIMAGARRYMAHVAGKETEFIKTLGPWLNKSRWEDQLPSKPPETNGADHDREGELRVRRQLYLAGKIPWNETDGPAPEPPFDPVAELPEYLRRGGTA